MALPEREETNRTRSWLLAIMPWTLIVITVGVLLSSAGQLDFDVLVDQTTFMIIYLFLLIFSLYFGVILTEGELSTTHLVGMVAFLAMPREAFPITTWVMFIGAVIGAVTLQIRERVQPRVRRRQPVNLRSMAFVIARVTLSFWVSGQLYLISGGTLPLGRLPDDVGQMILSLVIYALVYVTLYFAVFLLEVYSEGHSVAQILRSNLLRVAAIMILPIPFAFLGAEILNELSSASQTTFFAGTILIILALYALGVSEYQLRKQLNELRTVSVVTRAMRAHLNLDALLKTIYIQIAHLLDVQNFVVALYDFEEHRLNFSLVMTQGREETTRFDERGSYEKTLIGYVLRTEAPLLITENVDGRARELGLIPPENNVYSWLGVPLQAGGRELGAIVVLSRDSSRRFNRDDMRLLNIIAASSSIAIENAQLYRQQTERAEQLTTLNRVAVLLSGTLAPDEVLDTVISSASAITNARAVSVYLYWDDAHETLSLARSAGLSDSFMNDPPDPVLFRSQSDPSQKQLPMAVSDIAQDKNASFVRDILKREEKASFIELPLYVGDENLGVLVIYYEKPQVFTGDKIELLKTFANQAAQAIANARAYTSTDQAFQRSVEQLLTLAGIGRTLTSTIDLKQICDLILTNAADVTKIDVGMVVILDEVTRKPTVVSQRGYPDSIMQINELEELGLTKHAIAMAEVQRIENVADTELENITLLPDARSVLSVPILRGREALGSITLESRSAGVLSEEDSQFVSQIANQAVIAIDNARLFDRIAEDRDRMQVLLDAMEEGIMLIDEQGRIVVANPRIDLIGVNQSALTGKPLLDLLDDPDLDLMQKAGFASKEDATTLINNLIQTENYQPVSYVLSGELGMLHIRRQIIPIRHEDGAIIGLLLVYYNKTEEEELARSREEISRMIVHDLRSPLTAVTTSLKLLTDFVPKDADFYSLVETTTDASRRAIRKLLSRVDSLLDISKMESGQLSVDTELNELSEIAKNVISELQPLAQELDVILESAINEDVPPLNIDGDKVERLILNLVDNALKYSPGESNITIRANAPGVNGANPGYLRVDVIDQGPGVPTEYKETLFDRFVQIEGRRKVRRGVGLGLTFCRMVVEAHGGHIWIEDNAEGGSIFAFTLPLASVERLPDDE